MNAAPTRPDTEAIAAAAARWVARSDAGLTSHETAEFDRWLAADPLHRSAWEHYSSAWSTLDRPGTAGDAVVRQVAARGCKRTRRRIGAAAGLAVVVFAAIMLWPSRPAVIPTNAVVHLPEKRTLSDGSVVELRVGAEIAVDFSGPYRRVTLQKGAAHFSVAKDPSHPFVVNAGGVETRAVGTAFTVDLRAQQVEIIVTEGKVDVERVQSGALPVAVPDQRTGVSALHLLSAGERTTVDLAPESPIPVAASVSESDLNELLAWRSPRLEFTDTPLAEAIALMNQQGNAPGTAPAVRLVLDPASGDLAHEPVTGLFRADQSEAFVRMLEVTLGLRAEKRGDEIILRRK